MYQLTRCHVPQNLVSVTNWDLETPVHLDYSYSAKVTACISIRTRFILEQMNKKIVQSYMNIMKLKEMASGPPVFLSFNAFLIHRTPHTPRVKWTHLTTGLSYIRQYAFVVKPQTPLEKEFVFWSRQWESPLLPLVSKQHNVSFILYEKILPTFFYAFSQRT